MKRILEVVENLCERDHMVYHRRSVDPSSPETASIALKFRAQQCRIWCEFFIHEHERSAVVTASGGVRVPEDRMAQVYEFLVRANFGLKWGRFDMEPSTGDVQFVHGTCACGAGFSQDMVRHLIQVTVGTYNGYHRGLCSVAYGLTTPLEAVCQTEGPSAGAVAQVVSKLLGERSFEMPPVPEDGADGRQLKLDESSSESEDGSNE